MDGATQMDVLEKSKGKLTVNEQRAKLDKKPVEGGDTVYLQEQDHSLAWLAKRDAMPIDADATDQPVEEDDPEPDEDKIGRAHVCTPVNNAHHVCRPQLENK